MNKFTHKGYGRIYCKTADDVQKVHDVIRAMDDYEYEHYMPKTLVAPFSQYPEVVDLGKFSDLDVDVITARCWAAGVEVWVFDSGHDEYPAANLTFLT